MREFLEKDKVRKKLDEGWAKGIYPRNDIMLLHTSTEQEIVKSYFERLKKQIIEESEFAYANFEEYKDEVLGVEADELPDDDFRYGMERTVDIINEFLREQEKEK